MNPRAWLSRQVWLIVAAFVAVFVLSLALPVSPSSAEYGASGLPSCGSPLVHGMSFSGSADAIDASDASSWMASSLCANARAQRFTANAVLAALAVVVALTVLILIRQRRSLLSEDGPISAGGGIVAALVNPILGPIVGLVFAREPRTRRMLGVQAGSNLGLAAGITVMVLGSIAADHLGNWQTTTDTALELVALCILSAMPLAFPISLLVGRRSQGVDAVPVAA